MRKTMKMAVAALMVAVAGCAMSADAKVRYRGFLNLEGGTTVGAKTTGDYRLDGDYDGISAMFTTTHGVQLNKSFFIGVGAGFMYTPEDNDCEYNASDGRRYTWCDPLLAVPVYMDLRWELNITKKVTPFIDIKGGYIQHVGTYDNLGEKRELEGGHLEAEHGAFVQPTVGLRFRCGRKFGFSIGASYNTGVKTVLYDEAGVELGSKTHPRVSLNLGFDF